MNNFINLMLSNEKVINENLDLAKYIKINIKNIY